MSTQEEQGASSLDKRKPTRRAKVMRGVVTPIFGLLAVTCIVFGILSATIWKPSPQVDAQALLRAQYVVTDPGVLELVDDSATVTASLLSAGGQSKDQNTQICMAIGSAQDATGWVSGHTYTRIKGLSSWTQLETAPQKVSGKQAASSANQVDFRHSDMWQQVKCSPSSVSLHTNADQAGQVAIISVETPGNPAPEQKASGRSQPQIRLGMHWQRRHLPNFAMPFYFAGGLLGILAVLSASVFAMEPDRRLKRKRKRVEEEQQITIAQAFASVLSSILHEHTEGKQRHSRHASPATSPTSAASSSGSGSTAEGPKIVDVTAKNMVADQQAGAAEGDKSDAAPASADGSVQAYLKRFLQETGLVAKDDGKAGENSGGQAAQNPNQAEAKGEISDETSQVDMDDSTVGVVGPDSPAWEAEEIDDQTRVDMGDDLSDETTEMYESSDPAVEEAGGER